MQLWKGEDLRRREDFFKVLATAQHSQFGTMALPPGEVSGELDENDHPGADQYVVVLQGDGVAITRTGEARIAEGDVVLIPAGENHQFKGGASLLKTITFYGPVAYPDEG